MTKGTQEIQVESLADRLARLRKEHDFHLFQPAMELFGVSEEIRQEIIQKRNEEARELLRQWYATPDDKGDEWWDEFERELKANRVTFREVNLD